jgi:hypothetical protein
MHPPHESLKTNHSIGRKVNLGLVMDYKFIALDCAAKICVVNQKFLARFGRHATLMLFQMRPEDCFEVGDLKRLLQMAGN